MKTQELALCGVCGAWTRSEALFCRKCGTAREAQGTDRDFLSLPLAASAGAAVGASAALALLPGLPLWAGLISGLGAAALVWGTALVLTLGLPPSPAGARAGRLRLIDALEAAGRMRVVLRPRPSFRGEEAGEDRAAEARAPLKAA